MLSFRMFGKRVILRFGFFMMLLIAFLLTGEGVMPCLVCCMLHECGHLLCCRALHLPIRKLEFGCGGLNLTLVHGTELLPFEKAVALHGAGIIANLCFAGMFGLYSLTARSYAVWATVNLSLALYHAIPAKGLDGGRIWTLFGERFVPVHRFSFWELLGNGIAFAVFLLLAIAAMKSGEVGFAVAISVTAFCCILTE